MNLATRYMGLDLAHPIVASAGPLSRSVDGIRRLEDAGAAAVVMFSLFEEQIRAEVEAVEFLREFGSESHGEALSYFPTVDEYDVGIDSYLRILRAAAESVEIPVLGSLNGITNDWWIDYARQMEEAGAAGIELNVFYLPANPEKSGADVERDYLDILAAVKDAVTVPVAMKLGPYFSSMANMAVRLDEAGADALVLFNRFYQPDFDLENLLVEPSLALSTPLEIRLPLLWIALLRGRIGASLAATGGVHGGREAIKLLLAGADVVMSTSALLVNGPERLRVIRDEVEEWMEEREYESVTQLRGSMSYRNVEDPDRFVRANYVRILEDWKRLRTRAGGSDLPDSWG